MEGDKHVFHYRDYSFGVVAAWPGNLVYAWWIYPCGAGHWNYHADSWFCQKRAHAQLSFLGIIRHEEYNSMSDIPVLFLSGFL